MKTKTIFRTFILLYSLYMLTISCSQNKTAKQEFVLDDSVAWDLSELDFDIFLLPPADLMNFITGVQLKPDLTNPVENSSKYVNTRSKCINLGVYMADMAYLGLRNDKILLSKYLEQVKSLIDELKIYDVLTDDLIERMASNLQNQDTVVVLSQIMQEKFINSLESSNRQNILALVSIGVFSESLYLIISNFDEYEEFNELNAELLNQKSIFEDYYRYTEVFLKDPKISNTINELQPLKDFFNNLLIHQEEKVVEKDRDHHFTISGGSSLSLTAKDFEELKKVVGQVRQQLTK
jgi:hypothetical protein